MITLAFLENPLDNKAKRVMREVEADTLRNLAKNFYDWDKHDDFPAPTVCLLNKELVLREDWDQVPEDGASVAFSTVLGELSVLLVVVVAGVAAAALGLALTVASPKTPGQLNEPDPVFTLRGQKNKVRLGDPIEEHYGRCRIWPSYAAIGYNKYVDNEEYAYSLYCLGQGSYDVEELFFGDTEFKNFPGAEFELYEPGERVSLFRDNVETSVEVSSIELLGENEENYTGWAGPFTVNAAHTLADHIEVDVTLPNGLYYANDSGGLSPRTVEALFECRKIDDADKPLGDWKTFFEFAKTLKTNAPQRFTYGKAVEPGRYELRARRTNPKDTSHRCGNTALWELARAYLPNVGDYGDVTMLAVKAQATSNLNDNSATQLNLFATRKLPIWSDREGWSEPRPTRSAVWAMCNIFRSKNGAHLAQNVYFDLDDLLLKEGQLNQEKRFFDWTFDSRSTTWADAALVCRAVRGVPILQGSRLTLVLERPSPVVQAVFGPGNIVKGSFEWSLKIKNQDEYDGVEIEYVDPKTWKPETLKCYLDGSRGDYLEPLKLAGVTSRDWAYREGLYEESKRLYQRENVSFKTGLEGFIPTFGDLVMVNHDLPRWGQGGRVLGLRGQKIQLDTPVNFAPEKTHNILIKTRDGGAAGPFQVVAGEGPLELRALGPIDPADFDLETEAEPPVFLFGPSNLEGKLVTVCDIRPSGDDQVEIVGVNYDPRVFAFDEASAPALGNNARIMPQASLPTVTGLNATVDPEDSDKVMVRWNAAPANRGYVLQFGDAEDNYTDRVEASASQAVVERPYSPLFVRVAAIGVNRGPWACAVVEFEEEDEEEPEEAPPYEDYIWFFLTKILYS